MKCLHIRGVCRSETEISTEIREFVLRAVFRYTEATERSPVGARVTFVESSRFLHTVVLYFMENLNII